MGARTLTKKTVAATGAPTTMQGEARAPKPQRHAASLACAVALAPLHGGAPHGTHCPDVFLRLRQLHGTSTVAALQEKL